MVDQSVNEFLKRRRRASDFVRRPGACRRDSDHRFIGSRSSRIGRNTAINLGGAIIPLLLSLATVPAYLHLIGETRYGILAIIWAVLGYFSVFDLGLSRATANQIARMRKEPPAARERVFWTALGINASVGAIGGAILFFVGHLLIEDIITITPALRSEAVAGLPWLAAAVPLTTVTLVIVGALEGNERFLAVNSLAIVGLAMFQLAPLAYAQWVDSSLGGLIMSATFGLATSTALSFCVAAVVLPVRGRPSFDTDAFGRLVRYGGWVTITGLVAPLLTVLDRLVIGNVLGAKAVTRYTIAFALVSRAQILSQSLARAVFPRFSMLGSSDAAHVSRQSLRALAAIATPLTVVGAVTLEPFLQVWVGDDIASTSAPVGAILLMGVWVNSMAVLPFVWLQAQGRPDLPAKFHMVELVPYIGGLILGLQVAGIYGAAWAWSCRAAVDAVLLFAAARRIAKPTKVADWRHLAHGALFAASTCVAALTIFQIPVVRLGLGGALVGVSTAWAWRSAPPEGWLAKVRDRPG